MDLKTYWLAFKAGWPIILGAVVVAAVAGAALSWPGPPQYSSTLRLFVAAQTGSPDLNELYQRNAVAGLRVGSYVELARSSSVIDDVSQAVDAEVDPGALVVSVVPETVVLTISVTDDDPEQAREIAAAFGDVLPEHISALESVRETTGPPVQAVVIDKASEPLEVATSTLLRNLVAAVLLGLGVGCGIAVLRYALKHSSNSPTPRTDET